MAKPSLELKVLGRTVINTPTFDSYKEILRVFDCGGWMLLDWPYRPTSEKEKRGKASDEYNRFSERMEELKELGLKESDMCIIAGNIYENTRDFDIIHVGKRHYYKKDGYDIISPQEFYKIENISDEKVKEINDFFNKTEAGINTEEKKTKPSKKRQETESSTETDFIDPWKIEIPKVEGKNGI